MVSIWRASCRIVDTSHSAVVADVRINTPACNYNNRMAPNSVKETPRSVDYRAFRASSGVLQGGDLWHVNRVLEQSVFIGPALLVDQRFELVEDSTLPFLSDDMVTVST